MGPCLSTPQGQGATGADGKYEQEEKLAGKQKFIVDMGAVVMTSGDRGAMSSMFVVTTPRNGPLGLQLAYYATRGEKFFIAELTDADLEKLKTAQNVTYAWSAVFKSIATDVLRSKVKFSDKSDKTEKEKPGEKGDKAPRTLSAEFGILTVKEPRTKQPFRLTLRQETATPALKHKFLVEPMTRMVQQRRQGGEERDREMRASRMQTQLQLSDILVARHRAAIERIKPSIVPLREESAHIAKQSADLAAQIGRTERKMKRIQRGQGRNQLDELYERGGARPFIHLSHAEEHVPKATSFSKAPMADYIAAALPLPAGELITSVSRPPSDPRLTSLYANCPEADLTAVLQCLTKLDDWDFNVFAMEKATGQNALFYTTYAILYKLDLVQQLGLSDKTVRRFLAQMQAGYHPNPYHNATHAADVTHINYYIITKGGLAEKCKLSKEELLAAVLAGAIHDFDHPGFNNNFHTRTNAYLSTLYNDRSVLENHHVASVYEMVRNPEYNVFAPLTDDQRREIRDTMIEMVLSTDMGLHQKIFTSFRTRLGSGGEWTGKEDIRLALSMSIKMADTSNCGRPNSLYIEWAKNIANEFYVQGDTEAQLCIQISPFMDRKKEKEEFPKGQISFMNFVVLGMYEKMAEFLPPLDLAVRFCAENKEYWQQMDV